jgi:hypothetical protein
MNNLWNNVSSQKCEGQSSNEKYCDNVAGFYPVQNFRTECEAKSAVKVATDHRNIVFRDGYGWVSLNGCIVDKDSYHRTKLDRMTHGKGRHQLEHRNKDVPFKARGSLDVDTETLLKTANFNPGVKAHCGVQKDITEYRINYLPPENNPQQLVHIMPPSIPQGGWVRGGMDTRMEMRRAIIVKKMEVL